MWAKKLIILHSTLLRRNKAFVSTTYLYNSEHEPEITPMTTYSIAPQTSWCPPISKSDLLNKECPILGETFQTIINNRTSKSPLIIAIVQHVFENRVKNGHNHSDATEETTKKPEKKNHYFYFDAKSLWTWFVTSQDVKNPVNRQTCKKIEFIWLTKDLKYFEACNAVLEIAEGDTSKNIFSSPESTKFSCFEDMHTLALSCYEEDPSLKTHKQLELLSKFSHTINPNLLRILSDDIADFFLSSLGNVQNLNELTKLSSWESEILTAFENIDNNTGFKPDCIKGNLLFSHVIATLPKQNFSNLNQLSQITKAHPLVSAFYGMIYQREGNQKEADTWFRKSSTCLLHNSQQVAAIGSVLWISEAYFSCIDLFKTNTKEFPHHLKAALLKKLLPIPHLSSLVLQLATSILEQEPKNLVGLYTLGTVFKNGNTYHKIPKNFSKAVEYFSLCLAQQPNEPGVLLHLGEMYYSGSSTLPKNRKLALEYFEKALQKLVSKRAELLRVIGDLYYQGDTEIEIDYRKAFKAYQEIIVHHSPNDPYILTRLGNIFYYGKNGIAKDLDRAFEYYKTSLTYAKKDWFILNQLGNIYIDGSKKVEANGNTAFEYFTQALKESPHNADVLLSLAKLYWTGTKEIKSRYSKSIEYCQQILKINPKNVKALAFLANIYLFGDESVSRNISKVFDYINRARQISPNDSYTLAILGTIYSDHFYAGKKNLKKAIELFEKSLEGNKQYDYPYLMLSKILVTGGDGIKKDTIQAFSFFKIAVSLNPKNFKYGPPELQEAYTLNASIQNLG